MLCLSGQKCGNTAQKPSKFGILAINLPLKSDAFAQFLRYSQRLYYTRLQAAFNLLVSLIAVGGQTTKL